MMLFETLISNSGSSGVYAWIPASNRRVATGSPVLLRCRASAISAMLFPFSTVVGRFPVGYSSSHWCCFPP